jgi:hypothetical protein
MTAKALVVWIALALVSAAWGCRLLWVAAPALGGDGHLAAEALYLAELNQQRLAAPAVAPTLEAIATEVHRRATRLLIWIGLGLALCLAAAFAARSRGAITVAAGLVYLLGWIQLDAYAQVGLLQGLDLKLRLVQNDGERLLQFAVVDGVLPVVVTCAIATTVFAAIRHPQTG